MRVRTCLTQQRTIITEFKQRPIIAAILLRKGRWFLPEEMKLLRLRYRDEGAVADVDFEGLTGRAFDSMYRMEEA